MLCAIPPNRPPLKHERIVKETSRLFRERGFENVSVGEVGRSDEG
jgi:TetR/AcrR family transcriptional regulator, transcriptional repressor for nem operon